MHALLPSGTLQKDTTDSKYVSSNSGPKDCPDREVRIAFCLTVIIMLCKHMPLTQNLLGSNFFNYHISVHIIPKGSSLIAYYLLHYVQGKFFYALSL